MSAYRGGGERRPGRTDPPPRGPRTELVAAVVMLALGLLFLGLWWVKHRERDSHNAVVRELPSAAVPVTSSAVPTPTRPPPLSDETHRATVAAISIAGAAQQSNLDAIAKLAMAVADANTDPKTTCEGYDTALLALRKAVLAEPAAIEAGALGDVTAELADLEAARCSPAIDGGT